MKNKLRSTKMKQVATSKNLQFSANLYNTFPLSPIFPEPTKQYDAYLVDYPTINSDGTITLKFFEKIVMEGSNEPESIVRKNDYDENYAGVNVYVYYLPKEEKVTNFTWKKIDGEEGYDGPYLNDSLIKTVSGVAIVNSKEEKLQYTVKNDGYTRGGNTRLYINCTLQYDSTKKFYFYVDP